MANLHRWHIIPNDICEISKVQPDDQIHALWSCKEVEAVWGSFQWAHHAASPHVKKLCRCMTTLGNNFSLFVHGVYGIVETLYGLASLYNHCLVLVPLQVECFKNFLLPKTRPQQHLLPRPSTNGVPLIFTVSRPILMQRSSKQPTQRELVWSLEIEMEK